MGLFKPIWMKKNLSWDDYSKARQVVERELTGKKLKKAALKSPKAELRKLAMKKLTDEEVLLEVARLDPVKSIREEAVNRLTNQAALAEIARKDRDEWVRRAAVKKLTDQEVLSQIARTEPEWVVSTAAAKLLTDPAKLSEIAEKGRSCEVRIAALEKLAEGGDRSAVEKLLDILGGAMSCTREERWDSTTTLGVTHPSMQEASEALKRLYTGTAGGELREFLEGRQGTYSDPKNTHDDLTDHCGSHVDDDHTVHFDVRS